MTSAAQLARLAIWSAIDNWPALNPAGVSVFSRKIKHIDDVGLLQSAQPHGVGDIMAVEVFPVAENPNWQTNRMQLVPYTIAVQIVSLKLALLEDTIQDTIEAIYQAADALTPTMSYVRVATGYLPVMTQTSIIKTAVGKTPKTKCWQATISVLLQFNRDPFA